MDLIDLLGGPKRPPKEAAFLSVAPIELMSEFLLLVTSGRMSEALKACDDILTLEPSNKMILDYRVALQSYVDQGLESEEEEEEEEDDDDDDDDDEGEEEGKDDNNDDDDDDDKDNDKNEGKAEEKLSYSFHRMDVKSERKSQSKAEGNIP